MCLYCPKFRGFCKEWIKSLCMFVKSFKRFTVLLGQGKEVRKFIFAVVSLYRCYTIILIQFLYEFLKLRHTQVFVINQELYITIALFKGSLFWSFSVITIKNNLQLFLNLSFSSPEHSHFSIKAFTAVGKRICFRERSVSLLVTQNFWSEQGVSTWSTVALRINIFTICIT